MFKYLIFIEIICGFVGGLLLISEVQIPIGGIIKKILNSYIRRKSRSKNKNERHIATAFDYKNEILHKFRFKLGLVLLAIAFLLQLITWWLS